MRKIKNIFILLVVTLLLSGCVKYNVNMDIKKDKSMEFKIVYAFDTSLLGDKATFSDADLKKIKDQGFEVSEYSEGTMKGFTLTKKIDNIDDVSSSDSSTYSLSAITSNGDSKMFKLEKGFLKNKYTAKFDFDSSEAGLDGNTSTFSQDDDDDDDDTLLDAEDEEEDDTLLDSEDEEEDDDDFDLDTDYDYSSMMQNMDLTFTVTLPYKAVSNNATTVKNDGKELTWNLASMGDAKSIDFEFELYSFPILPIIIVVGGLFGIALIVTIIMAIKGGKKPAAPATTTTTTETTETKEDKETTQTEETKETQE